ncbi:MAG: rhamnogalacturonan lyase, partial [Bacteroidaceae bacterium]
NYDFTKLQREKLGRGLVAVRMSTDSVAIQWRSLGHDVKNLAFNVYRNGEKLNEEPLTGATFFRDAFPAEADAVYKVCSLLDQKELLDGAQTCLLKKCSPIGYINIPLQKPQGGVTPDGKSYTYSANDASIGDVDGDGEMEIILKWDPSNSRDNSQSGYTGNVFIDCYKLTGERLWRIDLGKNIRAGAHYTQFMVYDLDGDGRAEVVMKTADGTVDGTGVIIGDVQADWRSKNSPEVSEALRKQAEKHTTRSSTQKALLDAQSTTIKAEDGEPELPPRDVRKRKPIGLKSVTGRILTGPEYLTVFEGLTGRTLSTIDYAPARGESQDWGDSYGNRMDRFLACVAYLDGVHPSVVMCRGYYTRTVLAAYRWDGKELKNQWVFDTKDSQWADWASQGNHNLRVGDVDGDGKDEITYGSMAVDNDGMGLYNTHMGHGDALHLTAFDPSSKKLQVWDCHENKKDGSDFRDAATGRVIFKIPSNTDVGRCMAADIDPTNYGVEMWSSASGGIRNLKGKLIAEGVRLPTNMAVWWDGDLLREMLDRTTISKWDWIAHTTHPLLEMEGCASNNGSKANPCLAADIVGDWREEVLVRTIDNTALRLYVTPYVTPYRFVTFLEDPIYRLSVVTENVAYNQPTQLGFYFGADLK